MENTVISNSAEDLIRNLARIKKTRAAMEDMTNQVLEWGQSIPARPHATEGGDEGRMERLRAMLNRDVESVGVQTGQALTKVVDDMYRSVVGDVAAASAAVMSLRQHPKLPTETNADTVIDAEAREVKPD